jgi:hypothetical protein
MIIIPNWLGTGSITSGKLGWNLISGTAILVDSTNPATRAKTQGTVDVFVALAGAFGRFAVKSHRGYLQLSGPFNRRRSCFTRTHSRDDLVSYGLQTNWQRESPFLPDSNKWA